MQKERRGGAAGAFARGDRDDPFTGRSLFSSLIGSGFRDDPFDDPFFTRPLGSLFGSSSSNMFETRDSVNVNPAANRPVIKELNSDGEEQEDDDHEDESDGDNKAKESQAQLTETKGSCDGEKKDEAEKQHVRSQSFCYRKVTYGGVDGVYRTSTVSRRSGSNGVVLEESKAADKTTGQAEHRISRGIQNTGHSVTRMLKPDGKVETMQMLHNLNEDELAGFEESWKGNASEQVGSWKNKEEPKKHNFSAGDGTRLNWDRKMSQATSCADRDRTSSSNVGAKKVVRIPID